MTGFANNVVNAPSRVVIALGGNLPGPGEISPSQLVHRMMNQLGRMPGTVEAGRSGLWRTAPVPRSDQPDYVNAVVALRLPGPADPAAVLALLHRLEAESGRVRGERNAARTLDLDLIDVDGLVRDEPGLVLPHPRMAERAFVLLPLAEAVPGWRHPVTGLTVEELIARLPSREGVERLVGLGA